MVFRQFLSPVSFDVFGVNLKRVRQKTLSKAAPVLARAAETVTRKEITQLAKGIGPILGGMANGKWFFGKILHHSSMDGIIDLVHIDKVFVRRANTTTLQYYH